MQENVKVQIRESLIGLEEEPLLGKRLHGDLKDYWSLRIGKRIRIVYFISQKDKIVYVVAIGPRETIYQ
jgi:mRNA-degrading endonuclease RelE of RelBE toxin-antitoxin system